MILAINPNAALDWVLFIDGFAAGTDMRASRAVMSVGGKGLDAAVALRGIQAPVEAVSMAAGLNGKSLAGLVEEYGIPTEWVWVEGETRIANVIVETVAGRHSHVTTPGYRVSAEDCRRFLECIEVHLDGKRWGVMGGSLPAGAPADLYGQITSLLHLHGVRVVLDTPGEPMLQALPSHPDIAKMNRREFAATFGVTSSSPAELARVGAEVREQHQIENLVITCGEDGILALTAEGTYLAVAPRLHEVNAAGAGDAVTAALAYRFSMGEGWQDALMWAAAVSAAVVLTERTGECRLEDVERIRPQCRVEKIE